MNGVVNTEKFRRFFLMLRFTLGRDILSVWLNVAEEMSAEMQLGIDSKDWDMVGNPTIRRPTREGTTMGDLLNKVPYQQLSLS